MKTVLIQLKKDLVDAGVHSERGQVIKCDIKPGSIERSIDLHIDLII